MVTGKALQVNTSGGDISLQGQKGVILTSGHQTDNLSTAITYKEEKWYQVRIQQSLGMRSPKQVWMDFYRQAA